MPRTKRVRLVKIPRTMRKEKLDKLPKDGLKANPMLPYIMEDFKKYVFQKHYFEKIKEILRGNFDFPLGSAECRVIFFFHVLHDYDVDSAYATEICELARVAPSTLMRLAAKKIIQLDKVKNKYIYIWDERADFLDFMLRQWFWKRKKH